MDDELGYQLQPLRDVRKKRKNLSALNVHAHEFTPSNKYGGPSGHSQHHRHPFEINHRYHHHEAAHNYHHLLGRGGSPQPSYHSRNNSPGLIYVGRSPYYSPPPYYHSPPYEFRAAARHHHRSGSEYKFSHPHSSFIVQEQAHRRRPTSYFRKNKSFSEEFTNRLAADRLTSLEFFARYGMTEDELYAVRRRETFRRGSTSSYEELEFSVSLPPPIITGVPYHGSSSNSSKSKVLEQNITKNNDKSSAQRVQNNQGRGFKSKQRKVETIYTDLVKAYEKTSIYLPEVTRGRSTVRVHAKTYDGLNCIQKALQKIEETEELSMDEIGFHVSMKNRYQKKGILIYIRFCEEKHVPKCFEIYDSFGGHLKDHAIALSKVARVEEAKKQIELLKGMENKIKEPEQTDKNENKEIEKEEVTPDNLRIETKLQRKVNENGFVGNLHTVENLLNEAMDVGLQMPTPCGKDNVDGNGEKQNLDYVLKEEESAAAQEFQKNE